MRIPLAAVLSCCAGIALSGEIVWEPLYEPGCGGAIVSVVESPHDARHVISGGDMLGVAVSRDGGKSWRPCCEGLTSYEMAQPVFHPTDKDEVWFGSCMGPYVSHDGGKTWESRRTGMPKASHASYSAPIETFLFDPGNARRILAFGGSSRRWTKSGAMGALWVSEDGGASWQRSGTITTNGFTTASAVKGDNIIKAFHGPKGWMHLLADTAGWFSSRDGGRTWAHRATSGLAGKLTGVTVHPQDFNIVWAVTAAGEPGPDGKRAPGGLFKSTDAGRTFTPCVAGVRRTTHADPDLTSHFSDIAVSPVDPDLLYVSDMAWNNDGIWVSENGGASWRKSAWKGKPVTGCFAGLGMRLVASPTQPDVAYAFNSEFVLKTTDRGLSWTDTTAVRPDPARPDRWRGCGWNGWCSRGIVFDPFRKGVSLLYGMDASRGWLSDDNFKTWWYVLGGVSPWGGGTGAAFSKDGFVYVTTGQGGRNSGILVSADGGLAWRCRKGAACGLPETETGEYRGVWADPVCGRKAFVVAKDGRYVTEDGGESWQKDGETRLWGAFAADPTRPGWFFVRNEKGIWETEDWHAFRPLGLEGKSEGRIFCDAKGRLLVCRGRVGDKLGLWRYDPVKKEWAKLLDERLVCAVAADPIDPTRLVVVTADCPYHDFAGAHGIFVSSDDGKTWRSANRGLHLRRLACVAFDPFDPETLVVGTIGGGFVKARWPAASPQGQTSVIGRE